MPVNRTIRRAGLAAGPVALAALLLSGCTATGPDYFDDGSSAQLEQEPLMYSLMSGTLLDPPRPKIEYKQHPPLVVPPDTKDLPPVEQPKAVAAADADWPDDPDVARADAEAAKDANRLTSAQSAQTRVRGTGETITPDDVQAARIAGGGLPDAPTEKQSERADLLSLEELANLKVGATNDKYAADISEAPTRKYLIEPPPEYRVPAATAALPEVSSTDNTGAPTQRAGASDGGPGMNPTVNQ